MIIMKKVYKTILTAWLLTVALWNVFASDSTGASTDTNNSDSNTPTITLEYNVKDNKWILTTQKSFDYAVDKYLYISLKDKTLNNIKDLTVDLKWTTDKTSVAFVCAADEDVMGITFPEYVKKVNSLTDDKKKESCSKDFIFVVPDAWITENTFKFDKGDPFITITFNDNKNTADPINSIVMKDSDSKVVYNFEIEEAAKQPVVKKEEPKPELSPKKQEAKVVNTKKTGLWLNLLLFALISLMFVSAYWIRKSINE